MEIKFSIGRFFSISSKSYEKWNIFTFVTIFPLLLPVKFFDEMFWICVFQWCIHILPSRNIKEVKVETKFSIDRFSSIFSKIYEKWNIFTFPLLKSQISTFTSREVLRWKIWVLNFLMPYRMYFYDTYLWSYLQLNFSLLTWRPMTFLFKNT